MSLPVLLTSDMMGSPNLTVANGSITALLTACLVNGFNTQSVVSATASGGVVTFNFASAPGFSALDTVVVAGASNSTVNGKFRVQSAASNQVLVATPGVPDGAVGGTITLKFSPLGWTRPYSGTGVAAYRMGGSATHKRYLRVYDNTITSTSRFYARGYEVMTAISTGTGLFPTTAQVASNGLDFGAPVDQTANPTVPRPWIIVGTPRFFYLMLAYGEPSWILANQTKPPLTEFTVGQCTLFHFGELDRITKPADVYAQIIQNAIAAGPAYIARKSTGAGGSEVGCYYACLYAQGGFAPSMNGKYPSEADGGIRFADAPAVVETSSGFNVHRGYVPGIVQPFEGPLTYFNGIPAPYVGTILSNVTGVTGRVMLAGNSVVPTGDFGILLDEDWGDA